MNQIKKQKIVIVGGGSTGWIAAAALSKQLKPEFYDVTLVESSAIGTIGVGEAVIPPLVTFIRNLGINEQEFIQQTQASFKLGIEFRNWHNKGENYFHHFGSLGRKLDGHDFLQCWLKARANGDTTSLMDYAPAAVMAKHHRFYLPFKMPKDSPLTEASYAYHFDASLVAKFLRNFAEGNGVKRIDARIENVQSREDGHIENLQLDNGDILEGDFFLDCSGFKALLIKETLDSPLESWGHFLPCDRAVAMQTKGTDDIPPYTVSTAQDSGWTWRIPLQHRTGNGYVFSSAYCSDEEAIETLMSVVQGEPINEPRVIPFETGRRKQLWKNNCIALGLAGGFLEPLESTAIHLVTRGVQFMLELFPHEPDSISNWSSLAEEYDKRMHMDYEEIRDFIILHYCTTQRDDTPLWRHCKEMEIPESLRQKIALFTERGEIRIDGDELFKMPSWQAVFIGMGVIPKVYHPFVDMSDFEGMHKAMKSGRDHTNELVLSLPSHREFLDASCKAPEA